MKSKGKKYILLLFVLLIGLPSYSQSKDDNQLTRILFVFDASNSMNEKWMKQTRIITAKHILSDIIDSLRNIPNLRMALRVYGHQYPVTPTYKNCNDTKLEVPFGKNTAQQILDKLRTIRAKGTTPIALSLEKAAGDFPDANARNFIILLTDGIEECGGDPCKIGTLLHEKGITVRPFVVGIGLDLSYLNYFDCFGNYKSANTPSHFRAILKDIVGRVIGNTTAQINLNTIHGRPLETNVSMFLYKAGTKDLIYTFTHTLNKAGLPDTLILNPSIKYDLYVKTVPPVYKKNITLIPGTHNIIKVDAPQGELKVLFKQPTRHNYVNVRVMLHGKHKTLSTQYVGKEQKYIVGKYDLEILTLPRRYRTITISQSSITKVNIDAPGEIYFSAYKPVTGQIFEIKEKNEFEWVCDLDDTRKKNKLVLQPGKYEVVYRQKDLKETTYTRKKVFNVYSNQTKTIHL